MTGRVVARGQQPNAALRPYSRDLGWSRQRTADDGITYQGYYRIVGLRFEGLVRQDKNGKLHFYILKPPIQLIRDTEYGGCFHACNDGWFVVGFQDRAQIADVDSGIAAIQKVLLTAFAVRTAKRRVG